MKNTYATFLQYEILKAQKRINVDKYLYPKYQFLLQSVNSHYHFHFYSCTTHYAFQRLFLYCTF